MTFKIFLSLDPYLAQWLIHESGGTTPVKIKRGSAESNVILMNLKPQPKDPDYHPQTKAREGEVEILLPDFKYKDIHTYNYLDDKGKIQLKNCIRSRFLVMLWHDLMTVHNVTRRTDETIIDWMSRHGIECDDRNWNTIAKILQRKRAIYGPLKEKKQEIDTSSIHFCPPCEFPSQV